MGEFGQVLLQGSYRAERIPWLLKHESPARLSVPFVVVLCGFVERQGRKVSHEHITGRGELRVPHETSTTADWGVVQVPVGC